MDDVGAHCVERRLGLGEIFRRAPDHDRQCAGGGAADPARDRRVDKANAVLGETRGDALRRPGIDCRHVDAKPAAPGALDDALRAEIGRFGIARGRQDRDDEVARSRRLDGR